MLPVDELQPALQRRAEIAKTGQREDQRTSPQTWRGVAEVIDVAGAGGGS